MAKGCGVITGFLFFLFLASLENQENVKEGEIEKSKGLLDSCN
jgi:hypothetical protein